MKYAVIPARGGSKRIPRKNIRDFCGKPMIAWSIEAAQRSGCFDGILVSTDDAEIAEIARHYGAEVPFMRPATLADDHTGTVAVMQHATQWLTDHGRAPSMVCCIYATAPLLQANDLSAALHTLETHACAYVFSVTPFAFPIQRALRILPDQHVAMFQPEHILTRSQDLEPAYHDAGQFYWGRAQAWLENKPLFGPYSRPHLLPHYRVQDIDCETDWQRAELLFKLLHTAPADSQPPSTA